MSNTQHKNSTVNQNNSSSKPPYSFTAPSIISRSLLGASTQRFDATSRFPVNTPNTNIVTASLGVNTRQNYKGSLIDEKFQETGEFIHICVKL